MKQVKHIASLFLVLLVPLLMASPVFAESLSITHELHVTAVIPSHRDIILDTQGRIARITSNTLEDVTPNVYKGVIAPENKVELTSRVYNSYREQVPIGTAKYGILYENHSVVALISVRKQQNS